MHTTSLAINAPVETLWGLLTDTSRWPEWGPSMDEVRCSDTVIRRGSRGTIKLTNLPIHLPFEVTVCDPERLFWSWRVLGLEATSHQIKRPPHGPPEVIFGVPSPLLVPYLGVCRLALHRIASLAGARGAGVERSGG